MLVSWPASGPGFNTHGLGFNFRPTVCEQPLPPLPSQSHSFKQEIPSPLPIMLVCVQSIITVNIKNSEVLTNFFL